MTILLCCVLQAVANVPTTDDMKAGFTQLPSLIKCENKYLVRITTVKIIKEDIWFRGGGRFYSFNVIQYDKNDQELQSDKFNGMIGSFDQDGREFTDFSIQINPKTSHLSVSIMSRMPIRIPIK